MEFETYTVKVRVETVGVGIGGATGNSKSIWTNVRVADDLMKPHLAMPRMATSEPAARANHAVACADYGIPSAWPVSEGELRVHTEQDEWSQHFRTSLVAAVPGRPINEWAMVRTYLWATESEAVEGHKAIARWYGAL